MPKEEPNAYVRERRLATIMIISSLPNFVLTLIAGLLSTSLIVWMEFIESLCVLFPAIIIAINSAGLNKNHQFRFNYGTGKVEAITSLICEIFEVTGLITITLLSIRELTKKGEEDEYLLLSMGLLIIATIIDFIVFIRQKKLTELKDSKLFHTTYLSTLKEFVFDFSAIVALGISYLFRGQAWVHYISPILCLILAVIFFILVFRHVRDAIKELIDLTMDEESQLKVLTVLASYSEEYDELRAVRSRRNGEGFQVDIELTFPPEQTFQKIQSSVTLIKEGILKEFDNCNVNIVIAENFAPVCQNS